jgi:CO dehydrogenase maturation factor
MGFTISIAGKGGVGKTTIAALLIRDLCKRGGSVLAIDADPNYNLGDKLGIKVERTIGALREEIMKTKDNLPAGVSKQELVEYQVRLALQEEDAFDLLTMGRQEGPGCYCFINSVLRSFVDAMASKYEYIVIDNEAGLEHLSRRTTIGSDLLFIVCDSSPVALQAAGRIARLADEMELKIRRKVLVVNRCESDPSVETVSVADYKFDSARYIRTDRAVIEASERGGSLLDIDSKATSIEDVSRMLSEEMGRLLG